MANSNSTMGAFVPVNGNASSQAATLLRFGQAMQNVIAIGTNLIGTLNSVLNGASGGALVTAFQNLELLLGLPATANGANGQTAFNLVNGAMGAINGTMQNNQCANAAQQIG